MCYIFFILNVENKPVKVLIDKFENQIKIDVHPHGAYVTPAETEKGKFSTNFEFQTYCYDENRLINLIHTCYESYYLQ